MAKHVATKRPRGKARLQTSENYGSGESHTSGLNRLRKNALSGRKDMPQGLKADVFSIVYGPSKAVP
jgi:hypothetical protein